MVYWWYKKELGSFINEDGNKRYIYGGNCLAVYGREWNEIDVQTGKRKRMFEYRGHWNDKKHLSNCLGLSKEYHDDLYVGSRNWRLNAYYEDAWTIAHLLTKAGHKVTLYYKKEKGVK